MSENKIKRSVSMDSEFEKKVEKRAKKEKRSFSVMLQLLAEPELNKGELNTRDLK